jgi:hypothetical protein
MLRAGIGPNKGFCVRLIPASFRFSFYLIFALTVAVEAADPSQHLKLNPGLWEIIVGDERMPVPAALLEKLTPEQRARLQERMKARAPQEPMSAEKNCLTTGQLRTGVPFLPNRSCTRISLNSADQSFSLGIRCDDHGVKLEGTLQIEVIDAKTVRGEWRLHAQPKDLRQDSARSFLAFWKTSHCGPS